MSGIFFDARYIRPTFHDGISRFSANLFAALAKLTDITAIISDEAQLNSLPAGTKWVKINAPTSALEPFAALRLNEHKPSVVFSPMQTIGSLGRNFKLILTIHDLIYYRHPKPPANLPALVRLGWRLFHLSYVPERILLAGCEAVVAVSKATAKDIRSNKLTKKPITVVYNAPEPAQHLAGRKRPTKSLVYMGTFMDYKNVETLIRGVALLRDFRLELLSRISAERQRELQRLATEVGAEVRFHNGVTDDEYSSLLNSATALVSASLDEGFGIPVVEALEHGVPVAISDIEIFREIAENAGVFFEATNPTSFAEAIRSIEKSPKSPSELKAQAAKFNWDASAAELLKLIDSL
ncbi:MAG: glycosyltransferase family 1 protein [Rhodoluna sp.]|nr:glycosyltransferase family 1 protein [Rhodoluna sp.]